MSTDWQRESQPSDMVAEPDNSAVAFTGSTANLAILMTVAASVYGIWNIAWWVMATYHPMPWLNEWDIIGQLSSVSQGEMSYGQMLTSQYDESRLVLLRAIYWFDHSFLGGTNGLPILVNILAFVVLLVALVRLIRRISMPVGWSLIVAATICAFLLSGRHLSLFLWPFLTQSTLSMAFAVLCLSFGDMAVRRQGTPAIVPYLLLACLCALAASASQITGLIVWPLLFCQIVRFFKTPAPGPMAFVFLLGGAVYAAYLIGFSSGPVPGAIWSTAHPLPDFVIMFLSCAGSPAVLSSSAAVVPAGVVTSLLALGLMIALLMGRRHLTEGEVPVALVAVHALLACMMMALFHAGQDPSVATDAAFALPGLVLWACLFAVTASVIMRWIVRGRIHGVVRFLVLLLAPILAVGYNIVSFGNLAYDYRPVPLLKEKAAIAYVVGANDRETLGPVTGDPSKALALGPYLLRRGGGPFATESVRLLGERPEQIGRLVSGECIGNFDSAGTRFEGADAAFQASGWAWDSAGGQLPRRILLTGAGGRIIGIGLPGSLREDVADAGIGVTSNVAGWTAWAAGGEAPLQLYADMEGGRICRISEGIMP